MRLKSQRGDTIIEVMVSFAVFAMVAAGTLAVMNRGTATISHSLEETLVRAQIDAQVQALDYIHEAYVATYQKGVQPPGDTAAHQWWDIITNRNVAPAAVPKFGQLSAGRCPTTLPSRAFIINAQTGTVETNAAKLTATAPTGGSLPPYAQVIYDNNAPANIIQAYGITIQAVPSAASPNGTGFVDFHIRACWDAPGSQVPATLGTIVRLYDPR